MAKNPAPLTPEAQRFMAEFLADRSRRRAEMIESAGFPAPLPTMPLPPPPAPSGPVLFDEDMMAEAILGRVRLGLSTTPDERLYLRRKLFAVPAADNYVPTPVRALLSQERLILDAQLAAIDRAARSEPPKARR